MYFIQFKLLIDVRFSTSIQECFKVVKNLFLLLLFSVNIKLFAILTENLTIAAQVVKQ